MSRAPRHGTRKGAPTLPAQVAEALGPERDALVEALAAPSPVSIRINPGKPVPTIGEQVPWCAEGRYLVERPVFTLDPLFHAGCYYVQEASSMLLEQAFHRTGFGSSDILALDLCAAPGGKSTHLSALLSSGSLLVSNEPVRGRWPILCENLWKQGLRHPVITANDPRDLVSLPKTFDLIMVDAPCSGEGMFRKDPFARQQWTPALVAHCAREQARMLDHAWTSLKPGGAIIYSTCTWERSENEDRVRALLDAGGELLPLATDPTWGVVDTDAGHRCYPHRLRGEGFFIAVVRKPGESLVPRNTVQRTSEAQQSPPQWITASTPRSMIGSDDTLYLAPTAWEGAIARFRSTMNIVAPGTPMMERKGDRLVPTAAIALHVELDHGAFTTVDVDLQDALRFLRGEGIRACAAQDAPDPSPDLRLVRYEERALGFLSKAGDRWNNQWPKPWRIRMR